MQEFKDGDDLEVDQELEEFKKPVSGRSSRTIKGGKTSAKTEANKANYDMTPQNVDIPESYAGEDLLEQTP